MMMMVVVVVITIICYMISQSNARLKATGKPNLAHIYQKLMQYHS